MSCDVRDSSWEDDSGTLVTKGNEPCNPVWNQEAWAAHTESHLFSSKNLRLAVLQATAKECKAPASAVDSKHSTSAILARPCGQLTTYFEDRRKKRLQHEEKIAQSLVQKTETIEEAFASVNRSIREMQRASTKIWAVLNVAEKRLEVRSKRPDGENFRDYVHEALEQERDELLASHSKIGDKIKVGKSIRAAIDEAREVMLQHKLTLHIDRTSWPQELLGKATKFDKQVKTFCKAVSVMLKTIDENASRVQRRSVECIKKRIAETSELRRRLEKEIWQIRATISGAEIDLDKKRKVIEEHRNRPENSMGSSGPLDLDKFYKHASLDSETLAIVRQKIKAAAYTGSQGRQLDILFMRFDRDGTGQLDEDEVRAVLRRTLKISPSCISDAEVGALCSTLDSDDSGSVAISEIVDFLNADTDLLAMEEQWVKGMEALDELREHAEVLVENMRKKAAAGSLERACLNVTLVKGLELDGIPQTIQEAQRSGKDKRQKPLEPRVVEKVRCKLKQAVQESGETAKQCFSHFDGDGSGELEVGEIHKAIRGKMKIPVYAISDAEIISLCAMLDKDASGSVGIDELVTFVDSVEQDRTGVKLEEIKKVKTTSTWIPKPTVALIEKVRGQLKRAAKERPEGQSLEELMSTFDSDDSGELDVDEVRKTFRSTLKIPKETVTDQEIASLCVMLDKDSSGSVGIDELINFMKSGPKKQSIGSRDSTTSERLEEIKARRSGAQQIETPTNSARQKQLPAPTDAPLSLPPTSAR